ncbi:MAG: zinc-dependent metalloprotease [Flavobacteriaceae bacterium]
MKKIVFLVLVIFLNTPGFAQFFEGKKQIEKLPGYFNIYYDQDNGKLFIEVNRLGEEFLYVSALSEGLGSNDIGLDRGQLNGGVVVHFEKHGNRLVLIQKNQKFRASSSNLQEQNSVEEAFAKSVLFGFEIKEKKEGSYLIDITNFVVRDQHGVIQSLKRQKQGSYRMDASRSYVNMARTKAFENNVEFDAYVTLTGQATGREIYSVSPSANSITVGQHHSFVKLPEKGYEPRAFDPRAGMFYTSYMDYSSPMDEPILKRLINRHRLEKKNPELKLSEAVNPIVYYLDPGTPEPVRSVLLEGASWWNQAFESAGYLNAFQVKMLPEGVDPLDTRYNVIQWVHRSTRGWSYGASIADPRTGEIIKGHVSLGSLRIRQDYLIAQALTAPYGTSEQTSKTAYEMALARIRQLAAHEVGHTLGFAHNFAASTNERASVMDYPHPQIKVKDGELDFSQAYDTGIGLWDKIATQLAYGDFSKEERSKILDYAAVQGFRFISDYDSRSPGGAHPLSHLWDNGSCPIEQMAEVKEVRQIGMNNFSIDVIKKDEPLSVLEDAFAPVYFYHRYQVEALSKLIGGVDYHYQVKGSAQESYMVLKKETQEEAAEALIETLSPEFLNIPDSILSLFPPRAMGYSRTRESFKGLTGVTFDPYAAAATSVDFTMRFMLNSQRIARIVEHHGFDSQQFSMEQYNDMILSKTLFKKKYDEKYEELQNTINFVVMDHYYRLSQAKAMPQVNAYAWQAIEKVEDHLKQIKKNRSVSEEQILRDIAQMKKDPSQYKYKPIAKIPDGSPI